MDTFTPTTNAHAIPTVIAQEVLKLLPSYMGIAKFVSKDNDWSGKDFANYGDTLRITRPGALTVQTKTPGSKITTQSANLDKVDVKLDQHIYISILEEDVTKLLQKPDEQAAYARNMAIKMGEKVETYIYALHPNITNTVTFDGSSETTIDTAMRNLRGKFARLKVPQAEEKMAFLDTTVIDKLLSVTKYTSRDYTEGRAVMDGAFMKIYNNNIFETQLINTSGSPVTYHNIATTRYGIVVVNRPMPLDGNGKGAVQTILVDPNTGLAFRLTESYDTDYLGVKFTIDCLFGAAIADANQVIEVEST